MTFLPFAWRKVSGEERRRFVRMKAHNLVKYKEIEGGEEKLSFSRNISAGGVLFVAKENIPVGSMLEMVINFPQYPHPIKTVSKVVWSRRLKKIEGYETGVEFIKVDEDAKKFIEEKISHLTGKAKKQDEPTI